MAMSVSEVTRLGFGTTGSGARAGGMGGAFIAVADDATAASFNPAGLGQLRTYEMSMVGRRADYRMSFGDYTYGSTARTRVEDSYKGTTSPEPQFFSFTAPLKVGGRNLVLQGSMQRVYGLDQSYDRHLVDQDPADSTLTTRLDERADQSGAMDVWSLAAGFEASPRMLVGLAVNQWTGNWSFDGQSTYAFVGRLSTTTAQAHLQQSNRFKGRNFNFGLLWRSEQLKLGASYQTAFTAKYEYSGRFQASSSANPTPIDGPLNPSGRSYDVHWPETLGLGLAYRPHAQWLFALDWSRTPWSKARFENTTASFNGRPFLDPSPNQDEDDAPADVSNWRFGTEYLAFWGRNIIPFRLGAFREPQPLKDRRTGENRVFQGFTAGLGFKRGAVAFDVAFKRAVSNRTAGKSLSLLSSLMFAGPITSREKVTSHEMTASLIVQFKGEGLRKAARWVFVGD